MKKKSRFLTGLLSAVMALSLCAMPAMAEGDADVTAPTTTASTIDVTKTGSITIHKYLKEGADVSETGGTGEDNQEVPKGAEAAEGVGFTVYQVMNADELVSYYNGESKDKEVTISDYADTTKNALKDGVESKKTYSEQKTGADGTTKFENLPVGLYVVIETYKPAAVTQAVAPFLVSIPMTRRGETKTGEEWLYDVVVYPKNNTTTGNFELIKYGVVGNDKDDKVIVPNVQFKLEHLKDGVDYKDAKDSDWTRIFASDGTEYFVTDDKGKIAVKNLKPGTYRFTEIGYAEGKESQYIVNKNDQYVFVVNQDGTTAVKQAGAAHENDYDVNVGTIFVYNYVPDVDKKVKANGKDKTWQEAADYSVGDTIEYQITVTVPANIARLKTFTVTDTPTNLTDDVTSIVVKNEAGAEIKNTDATTYYTAKQNGDGFEIAFTPANLADYAGKTLTITYNATLKKDAFSTGTDGNPNTVNLIYSKNVKQGQDDTPDTPEDKKTIKDEAVVYTFEIDVIKKADNANGKVLEGVTFDLYKEVPEGTANAITGDAAKALGLDENSSWLKVNTEALTTDSKGKIKVSGLANGTYKLVETKTLQGYNLLSEPVDVTLSIAYKTTWSETKIYENGVLTKHDVTTKNEKFEVAEGTNGGTQAGTAADGKTIGAKSVTVINRKGFDLPVTGGFGTLLFSAIGVLLVVGGVGVLMSTKKKKGNA